MLLIVAKFFESGFYITHGRTLLESIIQHLTVLEVFHHTTYIYNNSYPFVDKNVKDFFII